MPKIRKNLDYLPLDVNIFADRKIKRLVNTFGEKGFSVYIILLTEIYKNGYYLQWDKDYPEDIAMMLSEGVKANLVTEIVNHCVNKFGLFDKELFSSSILTSKGIQQRYLHAKESICKKTFNPNELFPEFSVLEKFSGLTAINGDYSENLRNEPTNGDNRRQVKSSKVNLSEEEVNLSEVEIKDNTPLKSPQEESVKKFVKPSVEEIDTYAKSYLQEKGYLFKFDAEYFFNFYESKGWVVGKNKMKDWKATVRNWIINSQNSCSSSPVTPTKTVSVNENLVFREFLNGK